MFSTPLLTLFPLLLLLTTLTSPTTAAFSAGAGGVIPEEYRNQARDLVRFPSPIQGQGQGQQPHGQVEMLKKHFKRSVIKGKRGLSKGKRGCKAVTTTTTSVGAGTAIPTTSGGMVGSTLAPTATATTSEGSKTFESLVISSSSSLPIVNAPVIPSTTSTKATPSATSKPATTTSTTSTPAQTSAASTFTSPDQEGNGPFDGESTYYVLGTDGNAIGACGNNLVDSDLIAAASEYLFDSWPGSNGNPNQNPICGQYAKVSYQGKSVVVRIEDRCPGCEKRHLDLSPSAFSQLASFDVGMMDVTWEWVGSASG